MANLKIIDQLIYLEENEIHIPLKANEVFNLSDKVIVNNEEYSICNKLDISFSKISIKPCILFYVENDNIFSKLVIYKNNQYYNVKKYENNLFDYLVIDNVFYFIIDIEIIRDIYADEKCEIETDLSYVSYIDLLKKFKNNNIKFIDNVDNFVDELKNHKQKFYLRDLKANLFDYQNNGCLWLKFMYEHKCGCILGDEMGLGKTLQVIGLMGYIFENEINKSILVIAPVSLLENWKREIEKFYPKMNVLVHHGPKRTGSYMELLKYDVIVMSYTNAQSDLSMLNMIEWDLLAIDEAQNIKNPYAQRTNTVKSIRHKMCVAITGTPFENHLTDIWSLVDFAIPNHLGSISEFNNSFEDNKDSAIEIEEYLSPIMIRRRVLDVAKDLPERIDIPQAISMTYDEALFYDNELKKYELDKLKSVNIEKIMGLRMFCTHPRVYNKKCNVSDPILVSTKYERTCELLNEIFDNSEKAIIFTSFNEMIDIFYNDIPKRFGVKTLYINGSTKIEERQKIVDDFSEINGAALLVLNPKAAGVGLNITAANHVIHYNLEWNPAVEDQASARAYRRGQEKTVFVYRLFYSNTIEEVINDRIQRKRELSNLAVVGNTGEIEKMDLIKALSLSPFGGNND